MERKTLLAQVGLAFLQPMQEAVILQTIQFISGNGASQISGVCSNLVGASGQGERFHFCVLSDFFICRVLARGPLQLPEMGLTEFAFRGRRLV